LDWYYLGLWCHVFTENLAADGEYGFRDEKSVTLKDTGKDATIQTSSPFRFSCD